MYEENNFPINPGHPICPICGHKLKEGDSEGFEYVAGGAERSVYGYCDICHIEYSWTEVFVSVGYSNLRKG